MELQLDRDVRTVQTTTGKLYVNGLFECFILEDRDRQLTSDMSEAEILQRKVPGNTAIPSGRYQVIINQSQRFGKLMPLLVGVKGFAGVRIHSGNTAADTLGCLLTGSARNVNKVIGSRMAFEALMPKLEAAVAAGEKIFITIS